MIGIEFHDLNDCGSFDMAYLVDQGGFTGLLAGYLLNVFNIRLAPFLNNPMTLRLEPPLTITEEEIDYVISALYSICEILKMKDYALLYAFLIGDNSKPQNIIDWRSASGNKTLPPENGRRTYGKICLYNSLSGTGRCSSQ